MAEIGLFEAIYSQRQVTHYKPDSVPRHLIDKVIEAATKAPSGNNSQPWHFAVVTDPTLIAEIGRHYREMWLQIMGAEPEPDESKVHKNARYLAHHMHEVPVMIFVCVDHSRGFVVPGMPSRRPGDPIVRGRYASSVWPAIQNLFLAARALGLGTRITMSHSRREPEIKALLGLPEYIETVVLTPLGYPARGFGPTDRVPAATLTSYNGWANKRITGDRSGLPDSNSQKP